MKLHKHFLDNDIKQASYEYWKHLDLMSSVARYMAIGDIKNAKLLSVELTKAIHEMDKLNDKKLQLDRHNEIVKMMNEQGVQIQFLRGIHFDN